MLNPKHSKFAYFNLICVIIFNYYFVLCKLSIIINRCEQDLNNIIHFRYKWAFLTLNLWKFSFHLTFGIINSHLVSTIVRRQRQSGFILKCKIKKAASIFDIKDVRDAGFLSTLQWKKAQRTKSWTHSSGIFSPLLRAVQCFLVLCTLLQAWLLHTWHLLFLLNKMEACSV